MPPAGEPSGPSLVRSQQQGGAFAGVSAPSHQASLSSSLTQKSIDVVELENKKLKQKLEKVGKDVCRRSGLLFVIPHRRF